MRDVGLDIHKEDNTKSAYTVAGNTLTITSVVGFHISKGNIKWMEKSMTYSIKLSFH